MKNPRLQLLQNQWLEATIDDIQHAFATNKLTSEELVLIYLDRIGRLNNTGPNLNAILEVNPEALHTARQLDIEREAKGIRSQLHGIPIIIKDNIETAGKLHTTAGSICLANHYAEKDAFLVEKLRNAGGIILGKANLTEWANFMTEGMPNGFSSQGGQVLNPYGPGKFDTGGSSAGTGAGVAANLAALGIGTETSGSILSPASQNSLVGIKPTVGLISRSGIIPISHSQDTAGPMARTVKDAVYLLDTMKGIDVNDPITSTADTSLTKNFMDYLKEDGLTGKKIGIAREVYFEELDNDKLAIMNEAIDQLKGLGAETVDITIPTTKHTWNINVLIYEFKAALNSYLSSLPTNIAIRSLTDIIDYNKKHEDIALKYGQTLLEVSDKTSGRLTELRYLRALEEDIYLSKEAGIDKTMEENKLDAIVFPNNYGAAIPAKAGYPSITVPAGYTTDGEPVGITFTSTAFDESTLIEIAYAFEQGAFARKAPYI